ncbi:beta-eliminating lyase-related protein [Mesorhizobium temperatum]|uniref:beta-eliminating lyase-related protein n=1 Tax=Mesorhizobium temperatum TaxID=241416 RepID=UPI003CCA0C3A
MSTRSYLACRKDSPRRSARWCAGHGTSSSGCDVTGSFWGGGLRQAGFMPSAGIVTLQTMVDRLIEDHRRAQLLAEKIRDVPGIRLELRVIDTNMVFFRLEQDGLSTPGFLASCRIGGCAWALSARASFARSSTISSATTMSMRRQKPFDRSCRRSHRPGTIRSLVYARYCDCQTSR